MGRDESYIGVLIDDLTTSEIREPYRQMTGRAEFRLLLRQDNADLRLTPRGYEVGLISPERHAAVEAKRATVEQELARLAQGFLTPTASNEQLQALGLDTISDGVNALQFLRRPEISYPMLAQLLPADAPLSDEAGRQVDIQAKYAGYIEKQQEQVERMRRLEGRAIPPRFRYEGLPGMRREAQQKLAHFQPSTVGQASRIAGVNPADISVLLVHLERLEKA